MGMFDYIICEAKLPDVPALPKAYEFQTKCTPDQYMTAYTITADGRLTWQPYEMEIVPKAERPYPDASDDDLKSLFGSQRRVEQEPEEIPYHGDIIFYTADHSADKNNRGWWEYCARFTEGRLSNISLVEHRLPTPTEGEPTE